LSDRFQPLPEWLVNRIGQEIHRGIRLVYEQQSPSVFMIECIRLRLFLKGKWHDLVLDDPERLISARDCNME